MLLDRLKQETARHHRELEEIVALPTSRSDYRLLLETFYGFIAPWEVAAHQRLGADSDWLRGCEKTPWLRADLAFLGVSELELNQLPRCDHLPSTGTIPEIVGALYVLEGSTLGGQMISGHLEKELGLAEGNGCSYFRSYGAEVGTQWRIFRERLRQFSSPVVDDTIIRAAADTFVSLHRWFGARKVVTA